MSIPAKDNTPKPFTNDNLYRSQMKLLKDFLERGAISKAQYDHSARVLAEKIPHGK